jgi:hypothetical protein
MMNLVDDKSEAVEALLVTCTVEDLLRFARAHAAVVAEEELAAESTRPTYPLLQNVPWR